MKRKPRVMIVLGTRPEIIKLAPILMELQKQTSLFEPVLVWSGQHIELAKPFLKLFGLKPKYSFEVMQENQASTDICAKTIQKLTPLFAEEKPELLLVQGDTTTAFTAALCAYYHQIRIAHVEAGLRSGNALQPFPEEKNRELISHLAEWNFAPTGQAKENLLREGIAPKSIFVVGNSVVDSLRWLLKNYPPPGQPPHISINPEKEKLLVVTSHRRENFGAPLQNICDAVKKLVLRNPVLKVAFPVHLNPKVRQVVFKKLGGLKRVCLLPPLGYIPFIHLLTHATAILTDSGGVQEEAPYLGKPVLVLRDVTERPEGIAVGASRIIGRDSEQIVSSLEGLLSSPKQYQEMAKFRSPYGKGETAKKIIRILIEASQK